MLANFKSSLDPSSCHSVTSLLTDIREGAERLANDLDEYLESTNHAGINRRKESNLLSDEGIAELQLLTARKLREVRCIIVVLVLRTPVIYGCLIWLTHIHSGLLTVFFFIRMMI